jgi:hypothetical protein
MSAASSDGGSKLPSRQALNFLYNHVFLPPEVPQQDDYLPELDTVLMQTAQESLATLNSCTPGEYHSDIAEATDMLSTMQKIHEYGDVASNELLRAFNNVVKHGQ